jgi:hypothetical protein
LSSADFMSTRAHAGARVMNGNGRDKPTKPTIETNRLAQACEGRHPPFRYYNESVTGIRIGGASGHPVAGRLALVIGGIGLPG